MEYKGTLCSPTWWHFTLCSRAAEHAGYDLFGKGPGSNLGYHTYCPDGIFRGFLSSLQANGGIAPRNKPRSIPSTSLLINHSSISVNKQVGAVVTLPIRALEFLVQISVGTPAILTMLSCRYLQSLQENAGIVVPTSLHIISNPSFIYDSTIRCCTV
jgi:hypothetical protein